MPLRITGVPATETPRLSDAVLRDTVGHRHLAVRALGPHGRIPNRASKQNVTLKQVLGGALASRWYAAQVSVPRQLHELVPLLRRPDPGGVWTAEAGEELAESPYLYYYGGSDKSVAGDAPDVEKGPGMYLHYDAAENLVQVLDGWKEFWLYDPFQATSLLYGSNKLHDNSSPINVEDVNTTAYPLFRFALARKCTISAGEWLYVPLFWWHFVRSGSHSGERTVSLAHFSRGDPEKKVFFQKTMCGYSLRPAAFECA